MLPVLLTLPLAVAAAAPVRSPARAAAPAPFTEADVRPLLDGPLAEGQRAFAESRWEEAVRRLASPRLEARLMRALALLSLGRGDEAARALDGLDEVLPAMADRVRFWRGQALALAGRNGDAAAAFAGVPRGSLVWAEAQVARGRALRRLGDSDGALAALEPVGAQGAPSDLAHPDWAASALFLCGEIDAGRLGASEHLAARRAFVDCWAGHPLAPESRDCLERLRALPGTAGAPPGDEDAVRRVEALLEANRNEAALAELGRLAPRLRDGAPSDPLGCRARFAEGRAFRKERAHGKAIDALRPVVERCQDPALRVRALYFLASAGSIVDPDSAIEEYLRLARDFPDSALADDALFFAADLLARAGRDEEAARALHEVAERYPRGDYRTEALFRSAWLAKRQGKVEAAIAAFAGIEREFESTDAYEHARAAYWRARLLARRGASGRESARAVWASLAARYPTDYYGLLSRARLEEQRGEGAIIPPGLALPIAAAPGFRYAAGPLADDPHFKAGLLLLRLGLAGPAADELNAVEKRLLAPGPGETGADPLLLVAELLDRAGDHKSAHYLLRTLGRNVLRQRPEGANLRIWRVAYPAAYRREVQRWAPAAGVPVDLLQALMREESALDPQAISPAGAVGLTQLMVPTAQSLAKRLRLGRPTQADLMSAPLNIRLGASHLGELLRRFGGSAPLAIAAYNAGDGSVRGWLRAHGELALDEFIEEIPIQETRGYVKRVLRSYAAYRFLYGKAGERGLALGQKLPAVR